MPNEPALAWTDGLRERRFLLLSAGTLAGVTAALVLLNRFLRLNERRSGVRLADPLLAVLPARDFSWPVFVLIYGTLLVTLAHLARQPRPLVVALQAYALMTMTRIAMMWSIPLEPPPGMIMLVDPWVRAFGDDQGWAKDLFFSGHTSTTFLCALSMRTRSLRCLGYAASVSVAALVLWQHAHYTVDVMVAPFVAFASSRAARLWTTWALDRSGPAAAVPEAADARSARQGPYKDKDKHA